jgi:hypothetical protein
MEKELMKKIQLQAAFSKTEGKAHSHPVGNDLG